MILTGADLVAIKAQVPPFSDPDFIYEVKMDGLRCLATNPPPRLCSRTDRNLSAPFLDVVADLVRLPECAMDGELVVLGADLRPHFGRLQSRFRKTRPDSIASGMRDDPATLFAFDLLMLKGRDLRGEPIEARKAALQELLRDSNAIRFLDHVDDGAALLQTAERDGFEGIIAKRRQSTYRAGPSKDWLKITTSHGRAIDAARKFRNARAH